MKSNKEYRFKNNPKERRFHDNFKKRFENKFGISQELSAIVFGWSDDRQNSPKQWLSENEEDICINLIQWLGSPVGQGFLAECGFELKKEK